MDVAHHIELPDAIEGVDVLLPRLGADVEDLAAALAPGHADVVRHVFAVAELDRLADADEQRVRQELFRHADPCTAGSSGIGGGPAAGSRVTMAFFGTTPVTSEVVAAGAELRGVAATGRSALHAAARTMAARMKGDIDDHDAFSNVTA